MGKFHYCVTQRGMHLKLYICNNNFFDWEFILMELENMSDR